MCLFWPLTGMTISSYMQKVRKINTCTSKKQHFPQDCSCAAFALSNCKVLWMFSVVPLDLSAAPRVGKLPNKCEKFEPNKKSNSLIWGVNTLKDHLKVDANRQSCLCQVAFFSVNTSQWKPYVWCQSCLQEDSRYLCKFFRTLVFSTGWNFQFHLHSRASPYKYIYWMFSRWITEELTEKMLRNKVIPCNAK